MSHRHFRVVFRVFKLEVKLLGHVDCEHLEFNLCESLSEANATSSMEWNPTAVVALFTIRCLANLTGCIEALRDDFSRALPLL